MRSLLHQIDDEKIGVMAENEQLHMQLQELADENESLKREVQQYLPEGIFNTEKVAYSLKEMSVEQKLRMRVQELEDLVTEMKQQAGPAKVVELQEQLKSLSLELAVLQKRNKELVEAERKGEGKTITINGKDAADYYAQLLKEKEEEIEMLKKERADQEIGRQFNFA